LRLIEKLELVPATNPGFVTLARVAGALGLDLNALAGQPGIGEASKEHPLTGRPQILLEPEDTPAAVITGAHIAMRGQVRSRTRRGGKTWLELDNAVILIEKEHS
jgi:hypothetical protein